MSRLRSAVAPASAATTVRLASLLGAGSLVLLAACSGGSPSAAPATTSTVAAAATTMPTVAACAPSSVSATVHFTKFGGTSSSLAGAVLFRDTGATACSLHGVPQVQVVAPDGQPISTYQAPGPVQTTTAVVTPPAPSGTGAEGASSITFSSWTCLVGSFSLTVRFPGWTAPVPALSGSSTGNTPPPCTPAQEAGQTIYISPVTAVTG
jgi:hypothetical protein